jgi:hypothetical protein
MAERFAALVERISAAGSKGQKLDAGSGGGDRTAFLDAYLTDRAEERRLRQRVGTGSAMAVRRIRPSQRGSRVSIPDMRLVEMVCLGGADLTAVLRAHGWDETSGKNRAALREALAGALDRMMGYDLRSHTR